MPYQETGALLFCDCYGLRAGHHRVGALGRRDCNELAKYEHRNFVDRLFHLSPRHTFTKVKVAILTIARTTSNCVVTNELRKLGRLRFDADLENDPDLIAFVGIDSETDALPLGEIRKLWNPDALKNLQPEIDKAEMWAQNFGRSHCERLVKRFWGVS